jgi:hypothetical protein
MPPMLDLDKTIEYNEQDDIAGLLPQKPMTACMAMLLCFPETCSD